jgi:tetratricopeptide (TPR) repeat protein
MQPIAATLQDWFRALKVGGLMVLSCDIGAEVSVAKAPSGGLAPGFSMADLLGLMGEVSETTAYRIVHCLQSLPHIEGSTTVDLMLEKLPSPPVEPTQALLKAMQFHQQGDLSQAQPIYQTILAQHPLHFPALHMLGVVHFQRNELVPAEALLRQALALSERTWEAHYNLGCVLWQSSRFVEARDCFKRCLELNPEYEMAQARLSQLSAAGV